MVCVDEETIAKEVRLTETEARRLKQLSQAECLPEDVLLRKWVLEGLGRMRLRYACTLCEQGRLNLSGAARCAGVGVERMMQELTQRGIEHSASVEQFVDGVLAEKSIRPKRLTTKSRESSITRRV